MKTKFRIILTAILFVVAMSVMFGCSPAQEGEGQHEHSFSVVDRVEPTCHADGSVTYTCDCGERKAETIPRTGEHVKGEMVSSVPATCMENGTVTYACAVCGADMTEIVEAVGHTSVSYENVAPTCTKSGYNGGSYCSECGEELTPRTKLEATGEHNVVTYGSIAPTCTTPGYEGGTYCTVCNTVLSSGKEIAATGDHTVIIDPGYAASCGVAGLTDGQHCAVCGQVLVAQTVIIPLTHSYTGEITAQPEYMVDGEITYTCGLCGDFYTETIPALTYRPSDIWDGSVADGFASGDGSESNPYVIENAAQLAYLAHAVNYGNSFYGQYVKLANDIILNDVATYQSWSESAPPNNWIPIGAANAGNIRFDGTFMGEGHSVRGLYSVGSDAGGLFGATSKGTISGVSVTEAYIRSTSGIAGGIVGYADASDSTVTVTDCHFDGIVISVSHAGGIVGRARCGWYGFESGLNRVDHYGYVHVRDCTVNGEITSDSTDVADITKSVGGVVGHADYSCGGFEISRCTNNASVLSKGCGGGIVGRVKCSDDYSGKFSVTLDELENNGDVYGTASVGGISGYVVVRSDVKGYGSNSLGISDCYNFGDVCKSSEEAADVGGLFGYVNCLSDTQTAYLRQSYNCGNVSVESGAKAYSIGGIAGTVFLTADSSSIDNCWNSGEIVANNTTYTGGLFGYTAVSWTDELTVNSCYNTGNVTSLGNNVGGVTGYSEEVIYVNVYNAGNISGASKVGGIFGYIGNGSVEACYNAGDISGTGNFVGSICGQQIDSASVSYAYYRYECATDGLGNVQGMIGQEEYASGYSDGAVAEEDMKWSYSYYGFDFSSTWYMGDESIYPYPQLMNMPGM